MGFPSSPTRGATSSLRWPTPASGPSPPTMRGLRRRRRGPETITDYDIEHLTDDLIGLLDDMGEDKAVFVGHDWGSMVVWQLRCLHPDRVAGVVAMSVPSCRAAPMPPPSSAPGVRRQLLLHPLFPGRPGSADAELARDPAITMRRMLGGLSIGRRASSSTCPGLPAPTARGFVDRLPEPASSARLAGQRRARPLHRRVHPHRVHRRHQLVPQLRSQLGDHGPARRRPCHRAVAIHRWQPGPGAADEPAVGHGRMARRPSRQRA